WAVSSMAGCGGSMTRYGSTAGSTATWSAKLLDGSYDVAVWFPLHTNSTPAATFTVTHAGGTTDTVLDQRVDGGRWISLGEYEFTADRLGSVTLTVGDAPGNARGDAVRFTPVIDEPPHPGTGTWTASSSLLEDVQLANQTVRMVVRTSIGGEDLRLRLTNAFGLEPVTFGEVTVGEQQERAEVVEGSIRPVTFGGQATVTVASTRPRRSTTRFAARSKPSGSTPGTPSRLRSPSPSTRRQPSTSPPATRRRHRRRASRRPCRRRPVP